MLINGNSDIGKVRTANEDGYDFGTFEDGTSWAIVCDGMGGVRGGKIASTVAVEMFGDKIWALHMKGIRLGEDGELEKANFATNEANFKKVIDWTKVNMPETTVLREEIKPEEARADYAYMKSLMEG